MILMSFVLFQDDLGDYWRYRTSGNIAGRIGGGAGDQATRVRRITARGIEWIWHTAVALRTGHLVHFKQYSICSCGP
jgi:hypothetical protein